MASQEEIFKKLIAHCKEYGFVFASSEIYDGLAAVYDYGQNGAELKNNIKAYWWEAMTRLNDNVVGIDAAIFMHPTTWKASGHVDAFNDPLIDNRDSKKRYRADVLIEDVLAKFDEKIAKEVDKAAKRFGESFDRELYCRTNPRVVEYTQKRDALHERFATAMNDNNLDELKQIIVDYDVVCPVSGTKNWTDVRQFNLMFSTEIGSVADGATKVYLRPETAQGIFVNFLNVQKTGRMKIPFGIAQIGKAFLMLPALSFLVKTKNVSCRNAMRCFTNSSLKISSIKKHTIWHFSNLFLLNLPLFHNSRLTCSFLLPKPKKANALALRCR